MQQRQEAQPLAGSPEGREVGGSHGQEWGLGRKAHDHLKPLVEGRNDESGTSNEVDR